jgi:hypothetical protein
VGWEFYSVTTNKSRTAGEGDVEVCCKAEKRVEEGESGTREGGRREGREGGWGDRHLQL